MLFDVNGKNILITGCSSGIGKHFSYFLTELGANVFIVSRSGEKITSLIKEINLKNKKSRGYEVDVTSEISINKMIIELKRNNIQLDGIINNAGISIPNSFEELSIENWDQVMNTNLRASWLIPKLCFDILNCGASIINISSILATRTRINASYCASKAGVAHLTKSMAIELADKDIRVNSIAPGFVKTEMTEKLLGSAIGEEFIKNVPMKRAANVSDLEGALLLLLSDHSKYMTGSTIHVDGGLSSNKL